MSRKGRTPMRQAARVGSVLKQVLGNNNLDDQLSRYQAWVIWDKLVGEQIAHRARPLRFRQGILEVQVDHPVWMQQLQMLKPKILEKLQQQLPNADITDIYLRKAATPHARGRLSPKKQEAPKWQETQLSEREKKQIEIQLNPLQDPDIKDEMRRLITLQKKLDKGRDNS